MEFLRICGQDVRVDFTDPGHWHSGGMGRANIKDGQIFINSTMRTDIQHGVLLHEVLHFIVDSCGLTECKLNEEFVISTLACALHAFLRDNSIARDIQDYDRTLSPSG